MSGPAPSYAHGVSTKPLIGQTIGVYFDLTVARHADRPGLVVHQQGVRWTFRELSEKVDAFAAGLLALGLEPGDRVGIWSPNNAEWVVTQFATAKAGLVLVTINPAYRLSELEYALNKVGCCALVTATRFKTSDYVGMIKTLAPELGHSKPGTLRAKKLPHLRLVIEIATATSPGTIDFDAVYRTGGDSERQQLVELAGTLQFDDAINSSRREPRDCPRAPSSPITLLHW